MGIHTQGKFWRGVGHYRKMPAESLQPIELEPGVNCWTLFIPGKHKREWGFIQINPWFVEEYPKERER